MKISRIQINVFIGAPQDVARHGQCSYDIDLVDVVRFTIGWGRQILLSRPGQGNRVRYQKRGTRIKHGMVIRIGRFLLLFDFLIRSMVVVDRSREGIMTLHNRSIIKSKQLRERERVAIQSHKFSSVSNSLPMPFSDTLLFFLG